jgi:hypothetical protein
MKISFWGRLLALGSLVCVASFIVFLFGSAEHSAKARGQERIQVAQAVVPRSPVAVSDAKLTKSTAAYNGVAVPDTRVYVPWLMGGTSVLRVQNTNVTSATEVSVIYQHRSGDSVETFTQTLALERGAVGELDLQGTLTDTQLSGVLTADQPIAAVVNDFGMDDQRATSYAGMPAALGQTYMVLPYILSDNAGWDSFPVVQNVGEVTTSVTIIYTHTGVLGSDNWADSIAELGPEQVHVFNPREADLPSDFIGIATIRAEQPLVAVVNNVSASNHAYIYRPTLLSQESSRFMYLPVLTQAFEDWRNSEIQLVNASSDTQEFDLVIERSELSPWHYAIEGWDVERYSQDRDISWSPPGDMVAGYIEGAPALSGLVWLRGNIGSFAGDSLAAYSAPDTGALVWYLPYMDQYEDLATYVAVQNLGDTTVRVTHTYHSTNGPVSSPVEQEIAPFSMALYSTGLGFKGGMRVEADQPVAAVAVIAGRLLLENDVFMPLVNRGQ